MTVKITSHTVEIIADMESNIPVALRFMAQDIKDISEPKTPKKLGDLRDSTVISVLGKKATIKWIKVYAGYQEAGQRADGSHKVKKYTTPGTGPHFALNAVKEVDSKAEIYLRKARVIK